MAKLGTPRLTLVLADPAYPDSEEHAAAFEVQTRNVDLCSFDRNRTRLGWPDAKDGPFLWMTYIAWQALQRTGQIDKCSLAEFEQRCLSIENNDTDDVDPTQPEATSD